MASPNNSISGDSSQDKQADLQTVETGPLHHNPDPNPLQPTSPARSLFSDRTTPNRSVVSPSTSLRTSLTSRTSRLSVASRQAHDFWHKVLNYIFRPMSGLVTFVGRIVLVVINVCLLIVSLILFTVGSMIINRSGFVRDFIDKMQLEHRNAVKEFDIGYSFLEESEYFGDMIKLVSYTVMAFASLTGFMSILGCVGGGLASRRLLSMFSDGCALLLVSEIIVIIYIKHKEGFGKQQMYRSLQRYHGIIPYDSHTKGWNEVMNYLNCCGVEDYTDFEELQNWPPKKIKAKGKSMVDVSKLNLRTPIICCKTKSLECATRDNTSPENNNMNRGCYQVLFNLTFKHRLTSGLTSLLILFQIVCVFFSTWILRNLNR